MGAVIQFSLHFACICSGAAVQQTCGFGHEPQKNLLSKINIPQHSPPVMAGQDAPFIHRGFPSMSRYEKIAARLAVRGRR
jgi:hypothetical protein